MKPEISVNRMDAPGRLGQYLICLKKFLRYQEAAMFHHSFTDFDSRGDGGQD